MYKVFITLKVWIILNIQNRTFQLQLKIQFIYTDTDIRQK